MYRQHELLYFNKHLDPVINIIIEKFIVCNNLRQVLGGKKIFFYNFPRKCLNIELGLLKVCIGARIVHST